MRLADPLDQASGLRRLFAPEQAFQSLGVVGPDLRRTASACAAVARGLGRRGHRVLVMDEMRPPNNVAGLLGVMPRHGLVDAPGRGLVAVARQAGDGMVLLAAQEGLNALAGLTEHDLLDMTEDWRSRAEAPEWLLMNGGDGPLRNASLATSCNLRVLVLPGNRAALADAYAVMKAAQAAWSGKHWLVLVEGVEAGQALILFGALRETAQRFLGVTPVFLGCIGRDAPGAQPSAMDAAMVDVLSSAGQQQGDDERINFEQCWQRMWLYSRMAQEATGKRTGHGQRGAGER